MFRPAIFIVALALLPISALSARPFDWYYTRLGAPFAVFYNPALIGNNPGYTLGVDARHFDDDDYDIRGAVVIPVSRVMKFEEHVRQLPRSKNFRYSNTSYRSSATAVSFGGVYTGEESYRLSAGFVTPIRVVSTGLSFDLTQTDEAEPATVSMNAAISTDVPRVMRGGVLRLAFHNLLVSERTDDNPFGFSIGTGGIPFSDSRMYYMPYDLLFHFYMKDGKVDRVEGLARVTFDMSYIHTSRGTPGQSMTGAIGYNYVRRSTGVVDHKFFATLGVVFLSKASSLALMGSYGEGDEKYGTAFYSTFKRSALSEEDIYAAIGMRNTEDGKTLLSLRSGGSGIRSWVVRIDDERGGSIRTFSGGNVVPSTVMWDRLDSDGNPVSEDLIFIRLVLRGEQGRVVESEPLILESGFR